MRKPERIYTNRQQRLIEINIEARLEVALESNTPIQRAMRYASAFDFSNYVDNLPKMVNEDRIKGEFKQLFNAEYNNSYEEIIRDVFNTNKNKK